MNFAFIICLFTGAPIVCQALYTSKRSQVLCPKELTIKKKEAYAAALQKAQKSPPKVHDFNRF